jgi:hypothetical protein
MPMCSHQGSPIQNVFPSIANMTTTVARNPMFHNLDETNIDTITFQRLHDSGRTKKHMQSRRSLDNARKVQNDILVMKRKNGVCRVFTKEEISLYMKGI